MRNLLLLLSVTLSFHGIRGQSVVTISSGTSWVASVGGYTNFNGLTIQPASAYALPANTLVRSVTASPQPPVVCIQRVYQLQNVLPPYSGNLIFYYDDAELNGLNESQLALAVYNADGWHYFAPSANDPVANTVTVNGISNLALQQVTLVNSTVLPVVFGVAEAKVADGRLQVNWQTLKEENVSHFDIEASVDGKTFSTIGSVATQAAEGHSDKAISYTFSIEVPKLPAVLGLLGMAIVFAIHFNIRKKTTSVIVVAIGILACVTPLYSCKKDQPELHTGITKIYVRIAQVDTDGKKMYGKTIVAQNE